MALARLRPGAGRALCLAVFTCLALQALPNTASACRAPPTSQPGVVTSSIVQSGPVSAWYSELTGRYAHGVLGDAQEPTVLHMLTPETSAQCGVTAEAKPPYVFEDIAPRLVDLDADGVPEVLAVRSHANKGAQLAVYGLSGHELKLIAATPHIGTRNRWLAPVGAADFDGDGYIEIGYIDRPHLAKTLRLWRYKDGKLRELAALEGLTNHKIGWEFIASGVRDCGQGPEMITADAAWQHVMATRFDGKSVSARRIGAYSGPASITRALSCP